MCLPNTLSYLFKRRNKDIGGGQSIVHALNNSIDLSLLINEFLRYLEIVWLDLDSFISNVKVININVKVYKLYRFSIPREYTFIALSAVFVACKLVFVRQFLFY